MSARLPVTGCTLHIPGIFTSFFLPARALGLTRPAQLWHFSLQREPHTHNWPANAARRHRASQCWRSRAAPAEPESTEPLDTAQAAERLYSTLDPKTLAHQPGSVFGCAALVAGTTVGAGILALPYTTEVQHGRIACFQAHNSLAACSQHLRQGVLQTNLHSYMADHHKVTQKPGH